MFPVARKADEKIRKSEALKAKREEEKKKKLADKAAQKAAAAAAKAAEAEAEAEDGDEADGQEGNGDVRKRRCRTSCRVEDMAETDPEVLKEMRASPATTPFATFLTVDEFVGVVSRMPMLPACLRFKKGPLKKALRVPLFSRQLFLFFILWFLQFCDQLIFGRQRFLARFDLI